MIARYKILSFTSGLLLLAAAVTCDAQSAYIIDSLKSQLANARTDSARVVTCGEIALVYSNSTRNMPAAFRSCDSAWHIAARSKENPLKLKCYTQCIYAQIYRYAYDTANCRLRILQAEKYARAAGNSLIFGLLYHQKAMYYNLISQEQKKLNYLLRSAELLKNSHYHKTMLMNYHNITLVFQRLGDHHANLAYARKAFRHAMNPNDRVLAYYNGGGAHINLASTGPGFEKHIDSAIYMFWQANRLIALHRKRIKDLALLPNASNFLARIYSHPNYKHVYNMDSARHYLEISRQEALACGDNQTYASSSLILSKDALDANDIQKAERLLKEAKDAYYRKKITDRPLTEGDLYLASTFLYEKKKQYDKAIANYKRYIGIRDTIYNKNKLNAIHNTEAKFLLEKKEQEIQLLKEKEARHKRSIYFALALSGIALVLLFFLYRARTFRKKFFEARETLLQEESALALLKKEEADYALKLETEDTRKLDVQRRLEASQKEQYQKELMTSVLHLERKNELLIRLKESVIAFGQNTLEVKQVQKLIDENLELDNDFEHFSKNFEVVYPNFFSRLQERSIGNLTQLDLRYCAYIYMGLSSQEMSTLLNIDTASIRKARYRLKQKLNLGKDDDLSEFITGRREGPPSTAYSPQ